MENLGQHYTEFKISNLLIENISINDPKTILDLGIGEGSLTKAAHIRWNKASYYGADIDPQNIHKIKSELPFVKIVTGSGLDSSIIKKLELKKQSIDVAICNPPYFRLKNDIKYKKLFKDADLIELLSLRFISSDMIFLIQNLNILKTRGQLGIILPDSLLTCHDFFDFRKCLLNKYSVKGIIDLPEKIFQKTEAKTHILIIENNINTDEERLIPLYKADKFGNCFEKIEVPNNELAVRMDFNYLKYSLSKFPLNKEKLTLKDLKVDIKRGLYSKKELERMNIEYLHTTNIIDGKLVDLSDSQVIIGKENKYAKDGDILLSRVGRGCVGKVAFVNSGNILYSDCLYRIRAPKEFQFLIWKSLCSDKGKQWLNAVSHGVCAKVISKKDLELYQIELS